MDTMYKTVLVCLVCEREVSELDPKGRCTRCESHGLEPVFCACSHPVVGHDVDARGVWCPHCDCTDLRAA
jgi:DNA-directed RNA polymerase subunit RPC12/RpoP